MDNDINRIVHILESGEINALLRLYYNRDEEIKGSDDLKEENLQSLVDKNLIITSLNEDGNIVSLTDFGLSVCGSVIFDRIKENKDIFN